MRNYTLTKIATEDPRKFTYVADLYEDGNWTDSVRGSKSDVYGKCTQYVKDSGASFEQSFRYRPIMS